GQQKRKLGRAIALLPELEGDPRKQDKFVELVLSLLDGSPDDDTEGLSKIRRRSGSELLARLGADTERTRGIGQFFGNIAGSIGHFLNLTTWYVMKDRSATVGAGVAGAVRALRERCPGIRIHL